MTHRHIPPLFVLVLAFLAPCGLAAEAPTRAVRFSRDILPLLAKRCFACHGPADQESGLALHLRDRATGKTNSGMPAIVPGRPDQSQLLRRVRSTNPDTRMPHDGPALTQAEIEVAIAKPSCSKCHINEKFSNILRKTEKTANFTGVIVSFLAK